MRDLTQSEKEFLEERAVEAVALFNKRYDYPDKTIKAVLKNKPQHQNAILGFIETLVMIKDAIKESQFYAGIVSASASGMSRKLFLAFYSSNRLLELTEFGYYLAGCDKRRRMSGCGYDARDHALKNLGHSLGLSDDEIKPYWPLNISGD